MALKEAINAMNRDFTLAVGELDHTVLTKIGRLDCNGSLIDRDELEAIKIELTAISSNHQEMAKSCLAAHAGGSPLEEQVQRYKRGADSTLQRLRYLSNRLDVCEEMFHKYNVPRAAPASSEAVKSFMRVWREEAKKGRADGCMSLDEWFQRIQQEERAVAFNEMRSAVVDSGIEISFHIAMYFSLIAASGGDDDGEALERKFREVEAAIGCLRVEEDSGEIVERFLSVVRYVERTLSGVGGFRGGGAVPFSAATESDLIHLILREVLRLEVAFNCPDLPMMLVDEVYVGMARHLRHVFNKKQCRVGLVTNILRKQLVQSIEDEFLLKHKLEISAEAFDRGIGEIWLNNLDLD